jgi:RNA polymerase sigma-70 factor (ECF subfamily)
MGVEAPEAVSSLLARARSGDRKALDRLFAVCRNYVTILARTQVEKSIRAKFDPSDLVQQTLLEAFRGFGGFHGNTEAEWLVWLRRILSHNATDFARRYTGTEKRQVSLEIGLERGDGSRRSDACREAVDSEDSPSAQILTQERDLLLADALARLTSDHREVIILRNLQGLSFAEVARRLHRSRPAAQMLWMRALQKLQELLREAPSSHQT